ncbi:hypothetical protein RRF57_008477 [Xylaria bambusicola]|uniref:Uncharacterized protein n=1 Tax=Xylaria bambusicola TaxID=326684 RepID=A0AAN7UTK6_9PEZI
MPPQRSSSRNPKDRKPYSRHGKGTNTNTNKRAKQPLALATSSAAGSSRAPQQPLELGPNPSSEPATSSLIPAVLPSVPIPQATLQQTAQPVPQQTAQQGFSGGYDFSEVDQGTEPQFLQSQASISTNDQYGLSSFGTPWHFPQPFTPRYAQIYPNQDRSNQLYGDYRDYLPSEQVDGNTQAGGPPSYSFTQHNETQLESSVSTLLQPIPIRPRQGFVDFQSLDNVYNINDEMIWSNQPLMPPVEHLGPDLEAAINAECRAGWARAEARKNSPHFSRVRTSPTAYKLPSSSPPVAPAVSDQEEPMEPPETQHQHMVDPSLTPYGIIPMLGQATGNANEGAQANTSTSPSAASFMPSISNLVEQTPQASGSQSSSLPHGPSGNTSMGSHGMNMSRGPPAAPRYDSNVIITSDGFNVFHPTLLTKVASECAKGIFRSCPQAVVTFHQLLMADHLYYSGIWAGWFVVNENVLVEYHRPAAAMPDISEHRRRDRRGAILRCKGLFDETGWCGDTGEVIVREYTDPVTGGKREKRSKVFAPVEEMETRPAREIHVLNLRKYFYNRSLCSDINEYARLVAPGWVDYSLDAVYDNLKLLGVQAAANNPALVVQAPDDESDPPPRPEMPADNNPEPADKEHNPAAQAELEAFGESHTSTSQPFSPNNDLAFAKWGQCLPLPEWPLGELTTCDHSFPPFDTTLLCQSLIMDMVDAPVGGSTLATTNPMTHATDTCLDPKCDCHVQLFCSDPSVLDSDEALEPVEVSGDSGPSGAVATAGAVDMGEFLANTQQWLAAHPPDPLSDPEEDQFDRELLDILRWDPPEEINAIDYDGMNQELDLDLLMPDG